MSERKLDQYKGALTIDQITEGINAANSNAQRLLDDARQLLAAERHPSAASLAILAIEESGKASILRELAVARDESERREAWRGYRSHTRKNVSWLLPSLVRAGAHSLEDLWPLFDPDSDHPFLLDQLKQLGFYTDCLGEAHWSSPADAIDGPLARMLVQIAEVCVRSSPVPVGEVQLWVQHIGPVWKGPLAEMKKALAVWHAERVRLGFADGDPDEMARFVAGRED